MLFEDIIANCRYILEGYSKKRKNRSRRRPDEFSERPELSVGSEGLPRRGLEGTAPYGDIGYRTTFGSRHGQTSHT